jgi:probable phosphoglycerate mutase
VISGEATGTGEGVPESLRTIPAEHPGSTRVVLVRHGEARCNVEGIVGGLQGCRGLTERGRSQAGALAARLARTGELSGVRALYASLLPRAIETAQIIAPALDRWRDGPPLGLITDCSLCELHPGEGDGLRWGEFVERFGEPDWDRDPTRPLAPGGESWSGFSARAAAAVDRVARAHPGGLVVVVCHAGVVEASMLHFPPFDNGAHYGRGWLRTEHASLTEWELAEDRWVLRRYNDVTPLSPQQA